VLKRLGLNTEVSVLIQSISDWEEHAEFLREFSKFSVRTFRGLGYGQAHPHFPIISRDELHARYNQLLNDGLSLIVATPIDPAEAELAGCLLYDANQIVAEVALGPGTVRRVTQEDKVDIRVISKHAPERTLEDFRIDAAMTKLDQAVRLVQELLPSLNMDWLVVEFSWYQGKVGHLSDHLIFWELAGPPEMERELEGLRL
jgi:hypothetical protein